MLGDESAPLGRVRLLQVDVDEPIAWRLQVGAEGENAALVGDV